MSADTMSASSVLAVLGDRAVRKIDFRIGPYHVTPTYFEIVRTYIRIGKIGVKHDPSLSGEAWYYRTTNKIHLGFTATTALTKKALIIHESTHAAFDAQSFAMSTVVVSEAAAFVAQCVFARAKSPKPGDPSYRLYSDKVATDRIFKVAWGLAGKILGGTRPKESDYFVLKTAILANPDYKHGGTLSGWDGV